MLIEIKHRFNGSVLFSHDCQENSLRITLEMAVKARANLADAYLAGANLADETITIQPIKISGLTWPVLITDGYLRIGCQRHTHEQWQNFTDDEIRAMETGARLFWKSWKEPLMIMCKNHAEKVKK
jgi:hypothetical protein